MRDPRPKPVGPTGVPLPDPGPEPEPDLQGLVQDLDAVIWEMDADTWRFTFVSRKAEDLLGYPVEQWTAEPDFWTDRLLHPDDRATAIETCRSALDQGRDHRLDYRARCADGRVVWIRDIVRVSTDEHGRRRLRGVMLDITDSKSAESALRRSEERYRRLFQHSLDAVYSLDRDGYFTDANPACERLTGHTLEELRTMKFMPLIAQEERERTVASFRETSAGAPHSLDTAVVRKDGTRVEISVTAVPQEDGGEIVGVLGIARDITDRKRAEQALRESEERYRALVERSPDAIGVHVGDRLVFANRAAARLFGYERPEDMIGRSVLDQVDPSFATEARTAIQRMLRTGRPLPTTEMKLRHASGHMIYGEVSATPLMYEGHGAVQVVIRDVTRRKTSEVALRQNERRFRSLIENAMDTVAILDENGVVQFQSATIEKLAGYTADTIEGRSAFEFIHPEDVDRIAEALRDLVAEPGGERTVELRFRHRDGGWRRFEVAGRNRLNDPAVRGIVCNTRDVTDQRVLEQQLRRAQKLEAVGRLAGGVAHDFNNVLTAIRGHAQLALGEIAEDDPIRLDLDEIERNAQRASDLTHQLLAFSSKQLLQPRVLSPAAVIERMETMLRRLIGDDIELVARLDPELGNVRVDPGQVEQVVMNLVVNARDAMPGGGVVTIEAENATLDEERAERFPEPVRPGAYVRLTVADTGTGIAPEVQEHIFEPFFTTKEQGKGTGLGLATVYGIVEQSGGAIEVESAEGEGSTFRVYLPRIEAEAEALDIAAEGRECARGSETVLLVEDEPAVRRLVRKVLEREGYRVLESGSAADALDQIGRPDTGVVDLLLTDLVMPGMGGHELARQLAAVRPDIRILFMSGYTEDEVARRGIESARDQFLEKPFTPADLVEKVRAVLETGIRG